MKRTGILIGIAAASAAILLAVACSKPPSFEGTVLKPPSPAPDFTLQDQFGTSFSLSNLKGKTVVLTFLYTNCPDICPLTAESLHRAYEQLGEDTSKIEFVAVSVDPQRDSVEQAYTYSEEKGMLHKWRFLVGSEEDLASVWAAYYVGPLRNDPIDGTSDHDGSNSDTKASEGTNSVDTFREAVEREYDISHQAPVYLIDREGNRRVIITSLLLDPSPLVHDIRVLLK